MDVYFIVSIVILSMVRISTSKTFTSDVIYRELDEKCSRNDVIKYEDCKPNESGQTWLPSNGNKAKDIFKPIIKTIDGKKRACRYTIHKNREYCSSAPGCNATSYSYSIRTNAMPHYDDSWQCEQTFIHNISQCDRDCGTGKRVIVKYCKRATSRGGSEIGCKIEFLPCTTECPQWTNWKIKCVKPCGDSSNQYLPVFEKLCVNQQGKKFPLEKCQGLGDWAEKDGDKCKPKKENQKLCGEKLNSTEIATSTPKLTIQSDKPVTKFPVVSEPTAKTKRIPPPRGTTEKFKEKPKKEAKEEGTPVWVWVILVFILLVVVIIAVIMYILWRRGKLNHLKQRITKNGTFFKRSQPKPTVTITTAVPPTKHDGYLTKEDVVTISTVSQPSERFSLPVTDESLLQRQSQSISEDFSGDFEENIYATISSIRKKRRAPRPPILEDKSKEETKKEEVNEIVGEDGKIIRGDAIYSTINKRKKRQMEAEQMAAGQLGAEQFGADQAGAEQLQVEHESLKQNRDSIYVNEIFQLSRNNEDTTPATEVIIASETLSRQGKDDMSSDWESELSSEGEYIVNKKLDSSENLLMEDVYYIPPDA